MDALTTLLIGTLVTIVTQGGKKIFSGVPPLVFVALLSIAGGAVYAFIVPSIPAHVMEKIGFSFATAVGLYEVLKPFVKSK